MKAIILAGGFGTRLKTVSGEVPKPMVSVAGKPFLEHQITFLKEQGIKDIILAVHHMSDKIKSYFGTGLRWSVNITYSEEDVPLGTAGAIKNSQKYVDDTFVVLNGDSYSHVDIKDLLDFHRAKNSISTVCLTKSKNPSNYGTVIIEGNKIVKFSEKSSQENEALVNSGVYVLEPKIFDYIEPNKNVSIEKDIFPKLAESGSLWGYQYEGYFMDIGRPETYHKFKEDVLNTLILREYNTVRDALKKIGKSEINLIMILNEQRQLLGVLTERIIRKFLLRDGNLEEKVTSAMITNPITAKNTDNKEKIDELLLSGINQLPILDEQGRVTDVEFRIENIKTESFPILRGKAPLRISFAGGGTDLPYFFEKHGGAVINTTIDKYCYATIIKRADSKIVIDSDISGHIVVSSLDELERSGRFNLVKALIKLMNPGFGFELYLHNDLPTGRGLGASASFAVLIIALLGQLQGKKLTDQKIAEIAYKAEREELDIKGGWQDQYAAVTGGFTFMEFNQDKNIIYPLRLKEEVVNELSSRMLLCYVGETHRSGEVHKEQEETFKENEIDIVKNLHDLKGKAIQIRDCLLSNDLDKIGPLLHDSWMNKKKLSKSISSPKIDSLYEIGLNSGATGGKLLGAGNGGYIMFYYTPTRRNQLIRALKEAGGEIMGFNFDFSGTKIWHVENKFN